MAKAEVSAKHRMFMVPYDAGIANIVPGAVRHGGNMILPHTRDAVRLARNLGHTVPAPILCQYDWNGDTPFRTQKITAALLTMHRRAFVLSEMGVGKTRAALHAVNFLLQTGEARSTLVAAPLSTLVHVWDREVFRYFGHLSTGVLYGSKAQRLKVLAEPKDIYIINHDGVETILDALIAKRFDIVLIDELATYRNAQTDRWRAMNKVVNGSFKRGDVNPSHAVPFAWGLTGSPTPNEPPDAWAQCRLLAPHKVPPFYKQFKRETMTQVSQFRWIPKREANDIVYDAMQPAVRYKRADCIELPETLYIDRVVDMSPRQKQVYDELMRKLKLGFQEGTVTAVNEGVLFSKLLQICCGYVYTTDKRVVSLDNTPRLEALEEVLSEAEGKVIVFVDFIHAAHALYDVLVARGHATALVTGETPAAQRTAIFNDFENSATPRVLVAHPKCMSHGLTLVAANTIVWFSPTTSLETYEQACARITRPGQRLVTAIVNLTGSPVERKLFTRLKQKSRTQGALLEMFES